MGPGSQITQDLTLATAALTVEHTTCVEALKALETDSPNILWSPQMFTEFVVALQIELVPNILLNLSILMSC